MEMSKVLGAVTCVVLMAGCGAQQRSATVGQSPGQVAAMQPQSTVYGSTVPAGTRIVASLDQNLSSRTSQTGQPFTAFARTSLVDENGQTILPMGARLMGHVEMLSGQRRGSPGEISLVLDSVGSQGGMMTPIQGRVVAADIQTSRQGRGRTTAVGATAGGLINGVSGAIVGGVGGSLFNRATGSRSVDLPAGSSIAIEFQQPVSVAQLRMATGAAMGGGPGMY